MCSICDEPAFDEDETGSATIVFFCKHAFHQPCLIDDDEAGPDLALDHVASKVNYAALLMSSRSMACPICQEQMAKGNGVVHRIAERLDRTASSTIALV